MHHWLSIASHFTLKNVLANALLTFHRKSLHSQECARKCTVHFPSQVTSMLTSSHSGRLATVARFSLRGAVILLLRVWYCQKVPASCWTGRPCGLGFAFFVAQYLLRYCLEVPHVLVDRMPLWAGLSTFPIFLWCRFLLNWASPCHLVPP